MRWPFVSRAELDRALDELRVQRERYDRVLTLLLERRVSVTHAPHAPSAAAAKTVADAAPLPRKPRDPVLDAIQMKAGSNVALRRQLALYARGRRNDEPRASDTQIATEILHWRDATDDDALHSALGAVAD